MKDLNDKKRWKRATVLNLRRGLKFQDPIEDRRSERETWLGGGPANMGTDDGTVCRSRSRL